MIAKLATGSGGGSFGGPETWIARADLGLFAVTSPLGNSPAAAVLTLGTLAEAVTSETATDDCTRLREALVECDARWRERVLAEPALAGIGTTVAAMTLGAGHAAVGHLGDCRVHQIREGRMIRRTMDHVHQAHAGIILRGIGLAATPEVASWDFAADDTFVLTGGIHEVLSEDEIVRYTRPSVGTALAVPSMLDAALLRGATDYLTGLVVRVG